MAELIVVMAVGAVALAVFGLLGAVLSLVGWVLVLPFKLAAFAFKGLAALLALPFMLLIGVVAFLILGAGFAVFLIPAIPFVLITLLVVALMRGGRKSTSRNGAHTAG